MARLRRQWAIQVRTIAGDWSPQAAWTTDREEARAALDLYPPGEARVVSCAITDWEPDHGQA